MTDRTTFSLHDSATLEQTVECRCDGSALHIQADGYCGGNDLVRLEHRDGRLLLLVWANVNDDQPTQVIDLESSRQQHRNEVIAAAKIRLRSETMTPLKEGRLFLQVYECINWRTGKRFTTIEAADELNIDYVRFHNNSTLAMPVDGPSSTITDEDRKRLLDEPATPSAALISLLRRRLTAGGDR